MRTPALRPAFTVTLELSERQVIGRTPWGYERAAVGVSGGQIHGERLSGTVVAGSGGDWAKLRDDGVLDLDARYLLRVDDGTLIYLTSTGFARLDDPAAALRVSTRFEVGCGPHDWLTRSVFIGLGQRTATGNTIDYFALD